MEEFRPCMADRFVLTCINNRIFQQSDFVCRENRSVLLSEGGRRTFLQRWQERKKDSLRFYYLGKRYESKIEHFGCRSSYLPEKPLIL